MTDKTSSQPLVTELNVSANIMALEPGLYCVFHADNSEIDPVSGLPGVRITPPPGAVAPDLEIRTIGEGGWLGGAAALLQTATGGSVLVTIYRDAAVATQGPQLQVVRLGDAPKALAAAAVAAPVAQAPAAARPKAQKAAEPAPVEPQAAPADAAAASTTVPRDEAEVAAHIQRRGDTLARLSEWMGNPGSQQWIEGFAIAPRGEIGVKDVEYQAVLGRGWLSPWSEGGQFCGSRGMALPILGLRVRLKGDFAATHTVQLEASFTDGTRIGPIDEDIPVEAPSLAPLEAFRVRFVPLFGSVAAEDDADELVEVEDEPAPQREPVRRGRKPAAKAPEAPKTPVAKAAPAPKSAPAPKATPAAKPAPKAAAKPVGRPAGKPAGSRLDALKARTGRGRRG